LNCSDYSKQRDENLLSVNSEEISDTLVISDTVKIDSVQQDSSKLIAEWAVREEIETKSHSGSLGFYSMVKTVHTYNTLEIQDKIKTDSVKQDSAKLLANLAACYEKEKSCYWGGSCWVLADSTVSLQCNGLGFIGIDKVDVPETLRFKVRRV